MFLIKWFMPGNRTVTLSIIGLALAFILQMDAQSVFELAPMLEGAIKLALTIIVPLVPIFIRKAINNTKNP